MEILGADMELKIHRIECTQLANLHISSNMVCIQVVYGVYPEPVSYRKP
jgi:hypothetical protein